MPDFKPEQKATIQEILGKRAARAETPADRPNGLPDVPQPAGFRTDPKQFGLDPLAAQMLFKYLQTAPELRDKVDEVQKGPSSTTMKVMEERGDPMGEFPGAPQGAGIRGLTNTIGGGKVTINHDLPPRLTGFVLGHELGHVSGLEHDDPKLDELEIALDREEANRGMMIRALTRHLK